MKMEWTKEKLPNGDSFYKSGVYRAQFVGGSTRLITVEPINLTGHGKYGFVCYHCDTLEEAKEEAEMYQSFQD